LKTELQDTIEWTRGGCHRHRPFLPYSWTVDQLQNTKTLAQSYTTITPFSVTISITRCYAHTQRLPSALLPRPRLTSSPHHLEHPNIPQASTWGLDTPDIAASRASNCIIQTTQPRCATQFAAIPGSASLVDAAPQRRTPSHVPNRQSHPHIAPAINFSLSHKSA
jgi:hypothetical protein